MASSLFKGDLSEKNTGKKIFLIFFAVYTLILFIVTGFTQFSCYPMVTGGNLLKFCNNQERKLEIIKDSRTHGNTLLTLASNPESDESVLRALTNSLNVSRVANNRKKLESALAYNPNTPVDVLDAFVKSEDLGVLVSIAQRKSATLELLREVANNPHLLAVTSNLLVAKDFSIQKALEYKKALEVQKALINNPQIPEDVLLELAKSKEPLILYQIAILEEPRASTREPHIYKAPASVIREIVNNPVVDASDMPVDSQENQIREKLNILLARNKNTPEDVLKKLANSNNYVALLGVINNSQVSKSVIKKVGDNPITWGKDSSSIQISLASKNNVSRKIWEKLANSNNLDVLLTLSKNPALPSDLKNMVAKKIITDANTSIDSEPPSPEPAVEPLSENNKPNCIGKHVRNNLLGGAAAAVGFLFGGPLGALAAYGTVTGSLESVTNLSSCQF